MRKTRSKFLFPISKNKGNEEDTYTTTAKWAPKPFVNGVKWGPYKLSEIIMFSWDYFTPISGVAVFHPQGNPFISGLFIRVPVHSMHNLLVFFGFHVGTPEICSGSRDAVPSESMLTVLSDAGETWGENGSAAAGGGNKPLNKWGFMLLYLDLPRGAEWMVRGAKTTIP